MRATNDGRRINEEQPGQLTGSLVERGPGTSGHPPGLGLRLRVRLGRGRIDRELAESLPQDGCEDRALRAGQLVAPRMRRALARSLCQVVAEAENPRLALKGSTALPHQDGVLPCREALLGLAERLDGPSPINPCGVARALILLTEAIGPVYNPNSERSMGEAIWWVNDGLKLCPAQEMQAHASPDGLGVTPDAHAAEARTAIR